MYFEEKMIDGVLHYRNDPDGQFIPYTLQELSHRYMDRRDAVEHMNERMQELNRRLGM